MFSQLSWVEMTAGKAVIEASELMITDQPGALEEMKLLAI